MTPYPRSPNLSRAQRMRVTPQVRNLLSAVCDVYEIGQTKLLSADRHKSVVEARQVAAYFLRRTHKMSFPEVGMVLERDHSTMLHAVLAISNKRSREPLVAARMADVATRLLEGIPDFHPCATDVNPVCSGELNSWDMEAVR